LRVFAYCTEEARVAVARATGVQPLTSPPLAAIDFRPEWLEGYDVLYFRLHGKRGMVGWYGDGQAGQPVALLSVNILSARLDGCVAIVANCYGADNDPMVDALYRVGAEAVIAGAGKNKALGRKVVGTDLLAQWIIRGLRAGWSTRVALSLARARLALTAFRESDADALGFRIVKKKEYGK